MGLIDLSFGLEPQPWMERAYCATAENADMWMSDNTEDTWAAKKLCRTQCPVVEQCLRYAFDNDERDGVYGGLSAGERARARANGGKTTCEKNHPGEPSDIAWRPNGAERCNTCQRITTKNRRKAA